MRPLLRHVDTWLSAATAAAVAATLMVAGGAGHAAVRSAPPLARTPAPRPAIMPAASQTSTIDSRLTSSIRDRLSRATASGYGVVVDVEGAGRVVRISAGSGIRPASTQKLFTTLPWLLHDPTRRLVTDVRIGSRPDHGVVRGNLIVHASADPSLRRWHLSELAHQVRAAGIRKVTGQLRVDIGNLPLATRHDGWKWDFVPWDIGPLSPFPVNRDAFRRDSGYLAHPTMGNLKLFRQLLTNHGVRVVGGNAVVRSSAASIVVASHSSHPVSSLIKHTLRESDNFFAESLLSIEGRSAVRNVIRAAGIDDTSYATDGSGLSYLDKQTPRGEVKLLRYAHESPAADLLKSSLPVACRSGTLVDHLCGTIAEGKVWAKTGTLSHNKALSGYTVDALGRHVTFSILVWGVRNLTSASHAIDRAVLLLCRYNR